MPFNKKELMAVIAARELKNFDVVLVGIGLPNLAANLAKRLYAPNLILIYESGSIDCNPTRQPLSIGDPTLVNDVYSIFSFMELFSFIINGGKISIGFLGTAQVDVKGRLNTTVIGEYNSPKVRLPGSGGACEIMYYSKKVIVLTEFSELKIKKYIDFITSARPENNVKDRDEIGEKIITDKCIIEIEKGGRATIGSIFEDVNVDEIKNLSDKIDIKFKDNLEIIKNPTSDEIEILHKLDPSSIYLGD
ncbi:MAG: CoA-transferase [Candidatus Nanopusillus acidilobi]|jgi:glutaconate CoA-transferase subunit B